MATFKARPVAVTQRKHANNARPTERGCAKGQPQQQPNNQPPHLPTQPGKPIKLPTPTPTVTIPKSKYRNPISMQIQPIQDKSRCSMNTFKARLVAATPSSQRVPATPPSLPPSASMQITPSPRSAAVPNASRSNDRTTSRPIIPPSPASPSNCRRRPPP